MQNALAVLGEMEHVGLETQKLLNDRMISKSYGVVQGRAAILECKWAIRGVTCPG